MFASLRRWIGGNSRPLPYRARLQFEPLEDRRTPSATPDIVVKSVTTADSRRVTVNYEVKNSAVDVIPLSLVRSADNRFDALDVPLAPEAELDGSLGLHSVTISLDKPLAINPSQPFVLARIDAADTLVE